MKRRRQESSAVGHGDRQPGVVEDGHARMRSGCCVEENRPTLGKIHDREVARFRLTRFRRRTAGRREASPKCWNSRRRFRKRGLGKDVTHKFLPACRVCRRRLRRLITEATSRLHKMPAHTRTVCLEFSARSPMPCFDREIKAYLDRRPNGAILAGLEPSGRALVKRRLCHQGQACRPRRWCCLRDNPSESERGGRSRLGGGGASPMPAAVKASSPSPPRRASSSGSTAPHRGDREAHQRLQDQRNVVIRWTRLGGLLGRHRAHHIELSLKNKIRLMRRSRIVSRAICPCIRRADKLPKAEVLGTARRTQSRPVRAAAIGWQLAAGTSRFRLPGVRDVSRMKAEGG